jgi:hypothetical protein
MVLHNFKPVVGGWDNFGVGCVNQQPSIAILVRSTERWCEALETSKTLLASGARVAIFFIDADFQCSQSYFRKFRNSLEDSPIQLFTDHRADGDGPCLSLESMAQRIRQYDLVVPI